MTHSLTSSLFHVVFSTKDRKNLISANLKPRLWSYLKGIAETNAFEALAVGGTQNHVHVLLRLPPTMAIAKAAQLLKGGSSKWIHDTFPTHHAFAWQKGYGAFSIGVTGMTQTVAYIENQAVHHRARSFEDEYLEFVRRHAIKSDKRYVFG